MTGRPMKIPDDAHPISITPFEGRVRVKVDGKTVAETNGALMLEEASYRAVFYIPRDDVEMNLLSRTQHQTYCPFKGDASYFSLPNGESGRNAAWTYEEPFAAVREIKHHLAFYADKVEIEATG